MLGDLIISYNNKRKALNNVERNKKKEGKLYPYYGANGVVDYINEYMIEDEVLCIAEDGGSWGKNEKCSYIVSGKFWVNNHAHVVKTKKELDMRYLMYFLNFENLNRYITGTTRGKLTKNSLEKIKISIPSFNKQKEIVRNLEKIKKIIELKKIQLLEIENLKKSQFFEMFGDPIKNEKRWKVTSLDEISIKKGEYGSNKPSKIYEGGYRYIRITDIKENGDLKEEKVGVVDEDIEVKKYKLEEGDILFARSGATVGKTFLYRKEFGNCIFAGYLIRFKLDISKVNPEYIKRYTETEYYKKWVESCQNVVAQPNINAKKYGKELKIILPPLELQNKFATKIEAIQKLKFEIEKSLKETENLYNSLMQKFFSNK